MNSRASAPSLTTNTLFARFCFCSALKVSSTSFGLSSTRRISTSVRPVISAISPLEWSFVQHEPIGSEITYRLIKFIELNGLYHVTVHAELVALSDVFFFLRRSQNNYRNRLVALIRAEA